jgi:hypothetical protein
MIYTAHSDGLCVPQGQPQLLLPSATYVEGLEQLPRLGEWNVRPLLPMELNALRGGNVLLKGPVSSL